MIKAGSPALLGATVDKTGVNFAVASSPANRVELCLFDETGEQTSMHDLPQCNDGIWHGYLPGCRSGQRYGYRVHGPYAPTDGLRCNPAKLLIDPYARALAGEFVWHDAIYDYDRRYYQEALQISTTDSAPYVPKSVVCEVAVAAPSGPCIPWSETIFYEANVRGYTMRHPAVSDAERGTFSGLRNKEVLGYLKALGITSLELMPVHAFIDEQHLVERGLRNYWGYNTISFFAPSARYANRDAIGEFRDMVRTIHDAGIEVILDVVYNHTGESDRLGPSICFRGLDNLAYYRTHPDHAGQYINDTGCGNTLNVDHPRVSQLILDSLRYWHKDMGVDGFRFDLATILGRHDNGYSADHPLLANIESDAALTNAKLIAEPWDPGPGGYQLGEFRGRWAEWNDRYRDSVRHFWRGDHDAGADFAKRLHGSSDVFETGGKPPQQSVNLITSHDGFTLADLVSYEERHNKANGENNQDGHAHNLSCNYGIEGATDDPSVLAARRQHRLNLFATLLFSQGTPLILAGDEFGHTQHGNNNAYAQDNETTWLDWSALEHDPEFTQQIRKLIALRHETSWLTAPGYVHGRLQTGDKLIEIDWIGPTGRSMMEHEWTAARIFAVVMTTTDGGTQKSATAILFNASNEQCDFALPAMHEFDLSFSSSTNVRASANVVLMPKMSMSILQYPKHCAPDTLVATN